MFLWTTLPPWYRSVFIYGKKELSISYRNEYETLLLVGHQPKVSS